MAMTDEQIKTCFHRIRKIETESPDLCHRTYWDTTKCVAFIADLPHDRVHAVCLDEEYDGRFASR